MQAQLEEVNAWRERALDALLETTDDPIERRKALADLLVRYQRLEQITKEFALGASSGVGAIDVDKVRFHRLRVESRLAREQDAAKEGRGK